MIARLSRRVFRVLSVVFGLAGVFATVIGAMLAVPLARPPELASIVEGARAVDYSDVPEARGFQARDGTWLAFREYEPASAGESRIAVLIHGSSGSSVNIHTVGRALAGAGVRAFAIDVRGHGRSGERGDIAYIGQLDDDIADFVANLRLAWPNAPLVLAGHSAGGALALRIATGAYADLFERYLLLAPWLPGPSPVSDATDPATAWAGPDVPRIAAISVLRFLRLDCCESLPVLSFALPPDATRFATPRYSYRLFANFITDPLHPLDPAKARRPLAVICGGADEIIGAARCEATLRGAPGRVETVPGVNHMGLAAAPSALAAIVAAIRQ